MNFCYMINDMYSMIEEHEELMKKKAVCLAFLDDKNIKEEDEEKLIEEY